jgi:uncharacterized Fe-S cluster-containing protein
MTFQDVGPNPSDHRSRATLPGLDCGLCGSRTCSDFGNRLEAQPDLIERCTHLSAASRPSGGAELPSRPAFDGRTGPVRSDGRQFLDHLGRDFDFYLEHFPEDPGPREVILPHNPLLTRELDIRVGDVLIGRPLGMSCGCPITHCGVAMDVDQRTGVLTWCVTGPLAPRAGGFKDLGYYVAEAYEGMIVEARIEPRIGVRYFFQPRMCMLQWRHSGLVNYMNRIPEGWQVRLEGLWIG